MERADEYVYDFATNAWTVRDRFNGSAQRRAVALDTSTTAPLQGKWTKPAPKRRGISMLDGLLFFLLVGLVAAALATRSFLPLVFGISPALCIGSLRGFNLNASCLATSADRMLLENPDDLDVCLVGIAILCDGVEVGKDRGVAWFEDGKLLYNGHRTSFAIGGEDILPHEWPHGPFAVPQELPDLVILLRTPGSRTSVEFTPIPNISTPQEMRFLKRLYEFRRRPPRSRGPRQWPPFEPSS